MLVDAGRPGLVPLYRVYSHLVYAARGSDVATVLVGGRMVVRNGRATTVDEAQVTARAREFGGRVREVVEAVGGGAR